MVVSFVGFPRLLALFYADFHHIQGPRVVYEVPSGFMTDKSSAFDFDAVSEYIIPKPELCGRLVTVFTSQYKITGFPVSIEGNKYERNALIFNLCFVFRNDVDSTCYESVVIKIARVLRSLEIENEFLLRSDTKVFMLNIMEQMHADLNSYRECQIFLKSDDANTVNLKLFPRYPDPPQVADYDVPICITNVQDLVDKYWDLSMRRILAHVDGVNYIKKIALKSDVDIRLVRKCIQHLLHYGCATLIDIFQFSNVYSTTQNLNKLLENTSLGEECLDYVVHPEYPKPAFKEIFAFLCSCRHEWTVRDICIRLSANTLQIDIRRLVAFGVVKGILCRVHKYPLLPEYARSKGPQIRRHFDGFHHYDELCCMFGISYETLDEMASDAKILWKWADGAT